MRWRTAGLCMLSLVMMTACIESYRKGGRIDRAVRQDVRQNTLELRGNCPDAEWEKFCEGDDEPSEQCLEVCGG